MKIFEHPDFEQVVPGAHAHFRGSGLRQVQRRFTTIQNLL